MVKQADQPIPARVGAAVGLAGVNIALTFVAAMVLGAAAVFLSVGWMAGPKILLDRARYAGLTRTADARIVESWVALELDVSRVRASHFWRASAKATPCAIVEVAPDAQASDGWSEATQRALCGTRLGFNDSYTLADVRELAPHVPFAWRTDEHGFAISELRMDEATRQWLSSHDADRFMHSEWPAKSELDWLTIQLDRPIDQAIAGWSAAAAVIPVVFAPARPGEMLPAAIVKSRREQSVNVIVTLLFGAIGGWLWIVGFGLIPQLAALPPVFRWFVAVLPLLTLPTWADDFPRFLAPLNAPWSEVVGDMLDDLDPLDRLTATTPANAVLADGVRVRWLPAKGIYAPTFGRVAPAKPVSPYSDPDAALIALANQVADRVRSMTEEERHELFVALRQDKIRDLKAAGVVFLPAASEQLRAAPVIARAAHDFLDAWFTSPEETSDARDLAVAARKKLHGDALQVFLDKPRAQMDVELNERTVANAREAVNLARLDDENIARGPFEFLAVHHPQAAPFTDELNLVVGMPMRPRTAAGQRAQ